MGHLAASPSGGLYLTDVDLKHARDLVERVDPDGRISVIQSFPYDASGDADVAVTPQGEVYVARGYVALLHPGRAPQVVLPAPPGGRYTLVESTATGELLIADDHGRVLRRARDGVVMPIAGNGDATPTPPAQAPATTVSLGRVDDLAARADGGVWIRHENTQLALVRADGTLMPIKTLPASFDYYHSGLAAASDGSVYVAGDERIIRVAANGTVTNVAGQPGVAESIAGSGDGLPARAAPIFPDALAVLSDGGLAFSDGGRTIRYIAPAKPRYLAVAALPRRGSATGSRYRVQVVTTQAADLVLYASRGPNLVEVAHTGAHVHAGIATATLRGRFVPDVYEVQVIATLPSSLALTKSVFPVFLGGRLTLPWARRFISVFGDVRLPAHRADDNPSDVVRLANCRTWSSRRIDCAADVAPEGSNQPFRCLAIHAALLHTSGEVYDRTYSCGRSARPVERPSWRGPVRLVHLSRF